MQSGRYEVTGLGAGRYKISVSRPGFVSLEYGQTRPFQPGRDLELLDGQTLDRIDFALSRGGVITGRITDHNGEPQAGIPDAARCGFRGAQAEHASSSRRRPVCLIESSPTISDSTGFTASCPAVTSSTAGADAHGMMGMPEPAVQGVTYYPGTVNVDEAQSVEVEIGQDVPVHFALTAAPLARVSGTIVDSGGRPVGWRQLMLGSRTESQRRHAQQRARHARTARLKFPAVAPGNYTIEVSPVRSQPDDCRVRRRSRLPSMGTTSLT